jgi:hypothetical protein
MHLPLQKRRMVLTKKYPKPPKNVRNLHGAQVKIHRENMVQRGVKKIIIVKNAF